MATTVEQLYTQILGRAPDPEGLAFWQSAFGGSVDPTEQASFMQAAQAELANRSAQEQVLLAPKIVDPTSTGVTNADILGWFNANPNASDALIAKTMQEAGVTPTRLASVTGTPVAQIASLYQAGIAPTPVAPTAPVDPTVKLFQDTLGRAPTQGEIERFGGDIKAGQLSNFLGYARNEAVNTLPSTGAAANIASQILSQGTTDKWVGEGYGSATKNAYDMGVMLAGQGIKDINDFGQRTTPNGEKEFFNKSTGEAIKPFYDRAGDNIWGGTFAGKDSTAYGVEFDASGKPLFYSQSGGDSADVPSWVKPALIIGGAYLGLNAAGLLGGAGAAGTAGLSALDAGLGVYGTGGTAAGLGAAGLGSLTAGFTPAQIAAAEAGLTGSGLLGGSLTAGLTAADIAALEAGLPTAGSLTAGMTIADIVAAEAGLPGAGLGAASLLGGASSVLGGAGGGATTSVLPASVTNAITNAGVGSVLNNVLGGGTGVSNLISGGLGTAGNLLQMQQSREAAQKAQAMIDAETAAAKASAQFRPVGMTTRFGTSQFQVDPKTGQLTSAGYTLSPEAKAQQDRFMALSNAGLTQAEQAATQFAPLQTGAQRLFGLGNEYLAQSPEQVAQNYLTQQMNLLAPSREIELANLQTKLRNQGRIGLSVAQGGNYGATTPELQALYNARARQEAELAANAELAGQRNVTFGAGLLDQGSRTMGQYYSGQQGSYAPYTTAMGQVQSLEALGQQPFNMSNALAQQTSTAGARVGQLGLQGAGQSVALATGADATRNLGAQSLIAAGNPNAQFGSAIGGALGGLFNTAPATSGFSYGQYGTGIDPSTGEYFGSLYF